MTSRYIYVLQDKNKDIIDSNYCLSDFEYAKSLLDCLIYKTSVRTGKILDIQTNEVVYKREIYHHGE